MRSAIVLILALVLAPAICGADVIYVDVAGGGDYDNLQDGFSAAGEGDTVMVAPGTYSGGANRGVYIDDQNVSIISQSGPEATIIDCEGIDVAFTFDGVNVDSTTVIRGFTIENGHRSSRGGAIPIYSSSPVIENCIFKDCDASTGGAVSIRYSEAHPKFRNCVFLDNYAGNRGGAIYLLTESSLTLNNCVFAGNRSVGFGGALDLSSGTSVSVKNCTFFGNVGEPDNEYIYISSTPITFTNCIFSFSAAEEPMFCSGTPPTITHCISFGHAQSDSLCGNHHDNMFVDPLFCNVLNDNYELCSNSPCLPANNPWGELVGAYGQGCGDCDAPVENTAWGEIKSIFK